MYNYWRNRVFIGSVDNWWGYRLRRKSEGIVLLYLYSLHQKLYNLFNPLALRALPLYFLTETPHNATGHGRGGV